MAITEHGLLGPFRGRVGAVVGYVCNGRMIVRSAPASIRNPRTAEQQRGRGIFAAASSLARGMRAALNVGLQGMARKSHISARNLFISLNRHCINLVDGEPEVDYSRVRVAEGSLRGVHFGTVQRRGERRLTVTFDPWDEVSDGEGCAMDYVYLYAYAPQHGEGVLSTPAQRYEGGVELTLPPLFDGEEVQLYGFVWDREDNASASVWLGPPQGV